MAPFWQCCAVSDNDDREVADIPAVIHDAAEAKVWDAEGKVWDARMPSTSSEGEPKKSTNDGKPEVASESDRWEATQVLLDMYYGGDLDLLESDIYRHRKAALPCEPTDVPDDGDLNSVQEAEEIIPDSISEIGGSSPRDSEASPNVEGASPRESFGPRKPRLVHSLGMRLQALKESVPSAAMQIDINHPGAIKKYYTKLHKIGEGSFGTVHFGKSNITKALRAIKTIPTDHLKAQNRLFKREIEVCKLVDHPNIMKLYEIFEDDNNTYLILEACTGGTLRDVIKKNVGMNDARAATVMKQVFRAVRYLHANGICHRDLRGETIMFVANKKSQDLTNSLRITGFDLSCTFKENQVLKAVCGSYSHMAPEVLEKNYNCLADVWSVGVIMYEVCGGTLPFEDIRDTVFVKNSSGNEKLLWKGGWELQARAPDAFDITRALLTRQADKRLSLEHALQHKWINTYHPKEKFASLSKGIVQSLRGYRKLNKFKKASLSVIANHLEETVMSTARNAFLNMDGDYDGKVSVSEFHEFLERLNAAEQNMDDVDQACEEIFNQHGNKREVEKMMKALRRRQSYQADKAMVDFTYSEFLAATIDRTKISREVCLAAFQSFDKDGDGAISKEELMFGRLLGKMGPEERDQLLGELDADGNGEIDFEEFVHMMKDETGWVQCFSDAGKTS